MDKGVFTQLPVADLSEMMVQAVRQVMQDADRTALVPADADTLMTRKETANYLGITLPTLHKYTLVGIIPAYRFGLRSIRYKKGEVLESLTQVRSMKFRVG